MTILITRPREDADTLAQKLSDHGIESVIEPLLTIHFEGGGPVDLAGAQALVVTSANGLRAFVHRNPERDIDVIAVGDATARAARQAGFRRVQSAAGDVTALAELAMHTRDPGAGALVHVAGSRIAGDMKGLLEREGFTYRREVLYHAEKATALAPETVTAIEAGTITGVALYSPRTAGAFCALADAAGLGRGIGAVTAYCLSGQVAERVRALNWRAVRIAPRPEEDALVRQIVEDRDAAL